MESCRCLFASRVEVAGDALAYPPHVAGEPMTPLVGEARHGLAALDDVLGRGHGSPFTRPGAAAPVNEGRVHDQAASSPLAHGEGEVAVIAVKEAVALV